MDILRTISPEGAKIYLEHKAATMENPSLQALPIKEKGREDKRTRRRRVPRRRSKMKVRILGTGCPKCRKLYAEAEKAVAASGVPAEIEKVERIDEIMKFGVMLTPALAIDGEVKASGRIPSAAEIASWIATAAARESNV